MMAVIAIVLLFGSLIGSAGVCLYFEFEVWRAGRHLEIMWTANLERDRQADADRRRYDDGGLR